MQPREFLTQLWGPKPPGKVLIWTSKPKFSYWYTTYNNLDANISKLAETSDVYTGIGLAASKTRVSSRRRVLANNIAVIAGLWADIDIAHAVHKKQNLPPTMRAAIESLDTLYYTPTLLVNSGHGLQAWWLFDKPWVFADDNERTQAQTLSQWWHQQILQLIQKEGWTMDATHDLARVMRVPGTNNRKQDIVPVTLLSGDGPRFDRNEFLDRLPYQVTLTPPGATADTASAPTPLADPFEASQQISQNDHKPPTKRIAGGNIILSADAEPPATKLFALLENDPKFRLSWENRRPDFVGKSPSEYDFSLASMAFYADWTDQEVVDLLIHWRRMHGHPHKLRENYYTTTLAKAKQPVDLSNAQDRLEKAIFAPNPSSKGPEIIGTLTDLFKIPIQKIIRYAGDPPTYALSTDKADITLGEHRFYNIPSAVSERCRRRNRHSDPQMQGKSVGPTRPSDPLSM